MRCAGSRHLFHRRVLFHVELDDPPPCAGHAVHIGNDHRPSAVLEETRPAIGLRRLELLRATWALEVVAKDGEAVETEDGTVALERVQHALEGGEGAGAAIRDRVDERRSLVQKVADGGPVRQQALEEVHGLATAALGSLAAGVGGDVGDDDEEALGRRRPGRSVRMSPGRWARRWQAPAASDRASGRGA